MLKKNEIIICLFVVFIFIIGIILAIVGYEKDNSVLNAVGILISVFGLVMIVAFIICIAFYINFGNQDENQSLL